MSDFEERLRQAIERGNQKGKEAGRDEALRKEELERLRRLHTQYRLELSEQIEKVVRSLADYVPGFRYETVFGEGGWGAACFRDNLRMQAGVRRSEYSRLEIAVRPFHDLAVLDLGAKGTIANREVLVRTFFQPIAEASLEPFKKAIDTWALQYAELLSEQGG
jgi:hypothetical protein